MRLDTFACPVKVEWDTSSPLTPLGQIVYFIEFLKVSVRLDAAIEDCPLVADNGGGPPKRNPQRARGEALRPDRMAHVACRAHYFHDGVQEPVHGSHPLVPLLRWHRSL
jgi:hypothetical protein